jgi:hypothetical protein
MSMSDPNSLSARRRSLVRLLDYALNEAEELGFGEVARFLTLAATTLEKMPKRARKKSAGDTVVSLAAYRDQEGSLTDHPRRDARESSGARSPFDSSSK